MSDFVAPPSQTLPHEGGLSRTRREDFGSPYDRRARGFTLVELLVVMGIIALVLALAAPMVSRGLPGASIKTAASDVAQGLRRAQSEAIVNNAEVVFRLDVDGRRFAVGDGAKALALPKEIELSLVVGDSEVVDDSIGGIRFFPDGSSTGGRVRLAIADRVYRVSVDWLTGRVRVRGPNADDAP